MTTASEPSPLWRLTYEGFEAADEGLRETLTTLGNGRFATRGALADADADPDVHYPGTYIAGGYNRLSTKISGHDVENEDLVNWPNWLSVRLRFEEGPWLVAKAAIEAHTVSLDLKSAVLSRRSRLTAGDGRALLYEEERIVSMADPHLAAMRLTLTPLGWSGRVHVRLAIDAGVENAGVPRYRALARQHLHPAELSSSDDGLSVALVRTVQSDVAMALVQRVCSRGADTNWRQPFRSDRAVGEEFAIEVSEGRPAVVEKVVSIVTSRDTAIASPVEAAVEKAAQAPAYDALAGAHRAAWQTLWDDFDIEVVDGPSAAQRNLRLHLYHLIATLSPHTAELDVGAPARGWHGEAYRGHIFWDELFIFRVLNLRAPRLTRELLRYRHRRLPAARAIASANGLPGAMYPWQSGSNGREETQTLHLNPRSGRWLPDETYRQRHVGLGVAYNVWSYYSATGDMDFMIEAGTEMLVEIARLFAGLATWDDGHGRYRIRGVMGPDEFHTAYPDAADGAGGIDDNAYTNVLTAWVLSRAVDALENLPPVRRGRLSDRLGLSHRETDRWLDIAERLYVPFLTNGLIAQFEGYEALEELDWDGYRAKYGDIHRLDRILEAEGRSVNAYKVAKQADVLMLPFLFSSEQLVQVFEQLGYVFDPSDLPRLVAYYDARTAHGSTLSTIVHAWVVARTNRPQSWNLFRRALHADIDDVQGGTTREGIHLGAMCGTIDMVQNGYLGCEVRADGLHVDPVLPEALGRVATRLRYRGQDVRIEATRTCAKVSNVGGKETVPIVYRGHHRRLAPGASTTFRLVRPHAERASGEPSGNLIAVR